MNRKTMNRKEYPLRRQQVWAYALIFPMFLFVLLTLFSVPVVLMASNSSAPSFILPMLIILTFALFVILFYLSYLSMQQARLIIDNQGIRTSSKLLTMIPNLADFTFNNTFNNQVQIFRVENCAKTMYGKMSKLAPTDVALVAIKGHKSAPKIYVMSDSIWQIDDINELQDFIRQLGLPIQSMQAQDFIRQYVPQLDDMGKGAGIFAYSSIGCMLVMLLLSSIDKYSTIYYGAFRHSLWIIALVVGLLVFWKIKTKGQQLVGQVIVSILFAIMFSLMSLMLILITVPMLGSTEQKVFHYREINKFDEEKWLAEDNPALAIYCRKSENNNHNPQNVTVYSLFSIKRVNGEELCPDSKFMSDGVLPHE